MSNYTGSTPDTQRATNWRDAAACRNEDPEAFFAEAKPPAPTSSTPNPSATTAPYGSSAASTPSQQASTGASGAA